MALQYLFHSVLSLVLDILTGKLTRHSSQPSPANVPKPVDPNSAADFYGLFDARGNSAHPLEEQKVYSPFMSV